MWFPRATHLPPQARCVATSETRSSFVVRLCLLEMFPGLLLGKSKDKFFLRRELSGPEFRTGKP